jgi:hypothetical protein
LENNNRPPFPQANDLEKIVKIINIPMPEKILNDDLLGEYLDGITSRQARYYIAAAKFLGILDPDKHFSITGEQLRNMNTYMQKVELVRIVLSDKVFGTVFLSEKIMGMTLSREDIAEIIEKEHPNYCEAIYLRRAQTVISWINWINNQFAK